MDNSKRNKHAQKNRPKNQPKNKIDKLIAFFKNLNVKKSESDTPDYSSWNQTEEEYLKEQAEWLAIVKEKKQKTKLD